eukprot:jgi/Bigna1/57363/fgenesh1_pm.11_\
MSGGKDSVMATLRAMQRGHELVAVANLAPKEEDEVEMDSQMLQTAGHQVVPGIADCLEAPLFRRRTKGMARCNTKGYHRVAADDEVEDLFSVLKRARDETGAEAVVSGAILSDYQRLRVEDVCERLGMTSLAYLWRRDGEELLQELCEANVEAAIVKASSWGLDPKKVLGKTIRSISPLLLAWSRRYGGHVCGEGGEYETLTLDCPAFSSRIVIDDSRKMLEPSPIDPVGWWIITRFHIEQKHVFLQLGTRRGAGIRLEYRGWETVREFKERVQEAMLVPAE